MTEVMTRKPKFKTNDKFQTLVVHIPVLQDKNLTPSQKILFSFILAGYQGSQKTLGKLADIDPRTVCKSLIALEDLGYIKPISKGLFNMYSVEKEEYLSLAQK
ncbi:hypothetical protein [Vibrio parahaemolyticus]|uniref:hypothetical protein n=1 Tax=Vibrio parahaemolyticus TaxID=670 RepID=UPI0005F13609|nr:hypothetical protein [Vibrio parahaemolyticus]KJR15254.1 hypothetical protein UF28_16455 [Vibrio parahaemolyticus]